MAKSVLGNDPFQRGAAPRPPAPVAPAPTRAPPPVAVAPEVQQPPALPQVPGVPALTALAQLVAQALPTRSLKKATSAAAGSCRAILTGFGLAGDAALDSYGEDTRLVKQLEPLSAFLYDTYWRVKVDGAQNIPRGPAVLVANHSGALPYDGPVLRFAVMRERPELQETRWLVEDPVFDAPFFGRLFNRLGGVRANPENALALLGEGRPVIVFPEGAHGLLKPRRDRYQLQRFGRGGFVKVARQAAAPLIPVAIVGAEEATPLLGKIPAKLLGVPFFPLAPLGPIPLPSRWHIRFGAPIEAREPIDEVKNQTRDAIAAMLAAMLRDRTSAF